MDNGDLTSYYSVVSGYSYSVHGFTYTIVATDYNMQVGLKYRFRIRSRNANGWSDYSDTLMVGLGPKPCKPAAPIKSIDVSSSSDTSVKLVWNALSYQTLKVDFMTLYMDDGLGVNFRKVFSGDSSEFTVSNLTSGVVYSYYITATNFNGEGEASEIAKIKSCVAPMNVKAPVLVQQTSTSVQLKWHKPHDGGCPIQSYSIYSDNGNETDGFIHNLEQQAIKNQPYLFEYLFTFATSMTGSVIRFKLSAQNEIASTLSDNYL